MSNENDIRHGRHCIFLMHVHLVFVTKYRREVFTKEILDALRPIFAGVCADFEAELVEFDGEDDHVHLLINYPPKVSVSSLVNSLKGVSSRMIRKQNHPSIRKKLWDGALWSPSYFAGSCGGAPIEIIRQYIEQQQAALNGKSKDGYAVRAILTRPERARFAAQLIKTLYGRKYSENWKPARGAIENGSGLSMNRRKI